MTFKIGDRVTTKSKGNNYYVQYKIGTVVEIVTHVIHVRVLFSDGL